MEEQISQLRRRLKRSKIAIYSIIGFLILLTYLVISLSLQVSDDRAFNTQSQARTPRDYYQPPTPTPTPRSGTPTPTPPAQGVVAYINPAPSSGNQCSTGSLGMDFDVNRDISIVALGAFDSNQDGFRKDIFVTLYDRDTQTPIYTQRFNANTQYTLIGGSRFKELSAPFTIPANTHLVIAAYGYSCNSPYELNGNSNGAIPEWMTNTGRNAISFVGTSRYSYYPDQFPGILDTGPENRYAAGTLIFQPL